MRIRMLRRKAVLSSGVAGELPAAAKGRPGRRLCAVLAVAALAPLALAACGEDGGGGGGGGGGADKVRKMTLLVGTEPGGGFDLTARSFAKAAKDAGVANNVQVQNIPGAGNTIALARLVTQKGTAESMQVMGLGLIGGIYANKSKNTLADTTPIARLIQESEIIVVPGKSKYQTVDDLIQDWKANARKLNVGVASNPGGPDHVSTMVTAKAAGIDPKQVKTITFDGGGELNTALLGGKIDFGMTGIGEVAEQVESGKVRALAITAPERVEGLDVPTLKESGLDVDFVNWRGMAAPPGLSPDDKEKLIKFATDVHESPEWKAVLEKNKWIDFFQTGDEFKAFADSETQRVNDVMTELGLATS
jgi:putative tricarboxylic transport membrane protein